MKRVTVIQNLRNDIYKYLKTFLLDVWGDMWCEEIAMHVGPTSISYTLQ